MVYRTKEQIKLMTTWEIAKAIFLTGFELKQYKIANEGYLHYKPQYGRIRKYKQQLELLNHEYIMRTKGAEVKI